MLGVGKRQGAALIADGKIVDRAGKAVGILPDFRKRPRLGAGKDEFRFVREGFVFRAADTDGVVRQRGQLDQRTVFCVVRERYRTQGIYLRIGGVSRLKTGRDERRRGEYRCHGERAPHRFSVGDECHVTISLGT